MPLDGNNFVFVLESLDHLDCLQVDGVGNVHLVVVACRRHKVAVYAVTDPAHLLRVRLLEGKALSHVQIPD